MRRLRGRKASSTDIRTKNRVPSGRTENRTLYFVLCSLLFVRDLVVVPISEQRTGYPLGELRTERCILFFVLCSLFVIWYKNQEPDADVRFLVLGSWFF